MSIVMISLVVLGESFVTYLSNSTVSCYNTLFTSLPSVVVTLTRCRQHKPLEIELQAQPLCLNYEYFSSCTLFNRLPIQGYYVLGMRRHSKQKIWRSGEIASSGPASVDYRDRG